LGDGWITKVGRSHALFLTLDSKYRAIIRAACLAIKEVIPQCNPRVIPRSDARCVDVKTYCNEWPAFFPQHGPGRKHERRIDLVPWQRSITADHPQELIRGLIHSDGCRCVATVWSRGRPYRYGRYYFSNRSDDIRGILCEHLDLLHIRWTQSDQYTIQIARQSSVAALDCFVGEKA
jgi:hypothetical protein